MAKEDLETVIDRLLDYVRTNKKVSIRDASRALALSQGQVERLAMLLEESELMEVQYTIFGVKLVPRYPEPEEEATRIEAAKRKASEILKQTQALEREVMTSEHLLNFMEHDIIRRLNAAGVLLNGLEGKRNYTPAELEFVRRELEALSKQLVAFRSEINALREKEASFSGDVQDFRDRLKMMRASPVTASTAPNLLERASEMVRLPSLRMPSLSKPREAAPRTAKRGQSETVPRARAPKRGQSEAAQFWTRLSRGRRRGGK
ncbi:hypothetical protein COU39_00185 [Candidatus Micrarchaeota archaeon CG10_big_fil_rev_8_21_14_0_10_60_32]|nr:MAG: hypothetical protein AUJ16_00230 [Candidatus Micrarchaeota archaeon CG1_02_60_51]PIN96644.1 MAG: hypothetical protein COU39_00185 [Candidatus Micrarchaeota archaeon CG10_big_fil_rev_8_21_14_0_10_60_32]PIO02428.1 MAG: hypothetical protein COT58_00310 [Candidatus Micrarchaeota archaeon CG09_land_8_20_14_0_10_60_16]